MDFIKSLRLENIVIEDAFFREYVEKVEQVIIPYQWDILNDRVPGVEPSHCLDNFRIAAGEMEGDFYGFVFQDTDAYKWLEAVAFTLQCGKGKQYEKLADEVIDLLGRAQQPDGYLNTYFTIKAPGERFTNLVEGHEMYSAGHMFEAAVAYYDATGKDKLLKISMRFADLLCKEFGPAENQKHGYPGHPEIEQALVKLYRTSGKKEYLELAKYFVDTRGSEPNYFKAEMEKRNYKGIFDDAKSEYDYLYSQSHKRPVEQDKVEGHAVRAMYLCAAMADLAGEYQDEALTRACETLWNNMVERRMYITGGIGSSGHWERFTTDYDLPNDRNYSETCASIGIMMFGKRMCAMKKDASYIDVLERALYNTVLAGISLSGDHYFYVNPLEVWPDNCMYHTSLDFVKPVRQGWFACACCPPNVARTLASLGQYIYGQDAKGIYVDLFISSTAKTEVDGKELVLQQTSTLTKDGRVTLRFQNASPVATTVYVRIPSYSLKTEIDITGNVMLGAVKNGYQEISGVFDNQTEIKITFDVAAKWVGANPLVRADAGKVALVKGPFVYCLEEEDNGKNLPALRINTKNGIRETMDGPFVGDIPILHYHADKVSMKGWESGALYGSPEYETEDVECKAIPYCLWCNRTPGEMIVWQIAEN